MASTKSIRIGEDLLKVANSRAKLLGYDTWADYVRSLIRYDALVGGKEHPITQPISKRTAEDQDKIDAKIADLVEQGGDGVRGVLFERLLEKVAKLEQTDEAELQRRVVDELLK